MEEITMFRIRSTARVSMQVAALLVAVGSSSWAQPYGATHRMELTPFGSYQWGGSFETSALGNVSAGKLTENSSFSWGAMLTFLTSASSAAELYYLRQDTKVDFDPNIGEKRTAGDFANNYIQLGFRQDLPVASALRPFITGSMGINVLDPKAASLGSSTRFSWSLGGGARFMKEGSRVGLRIDAKWMVTPVPSGTYGTWCDYWGCFAAEGTTWLHQGNFGGGLIIAF